MRWCSGASLPKDGAAANEARALPLLDGLGGRAPRLLGADPAGSRLGRPAVLITRLPGDADITSVAPETAAVRLGQALAHVHAVPAASVAGLRDGMAAALGSPLRGDGSAPGADVLAASGHRPAGAEHVLTHYDFWSGNVLWQGDVLTGVVDWSGASVAPRGFDVSWCRLGLVLLHGPDVAELFTAAYRDSAGVPVPDLALWDAFAVTQSHLTASDLRERHTAWTERRLPLCG